VNTYHIQVPTGARVPILLSVPHCGTFFPEEIKEEFSQAMIEAPDDTDWFVDRLYSFSSSAGMTMISAEVSRWVIDLNRHPESKPLYFDGRIITDLCPVTTFAAEPLYKDARKQVDGKEVQRRKELYFKPYHEKLTELLAELKREFGKVLLWDCHSIRQRVPTIQKDKFPDLILGSADGTSTGENLIGLAMETLSSGGYRIQHNQPFKGGYITRQYGIPEQDQHALQLEMTKINYMDDSENFFDEARAVKMQKLLLKTLSNLGSALISGKD
jgi:N-formylglutamate deformylase